MYDMGEGGEGPSARDRVSTCDKDPSLLCSHGEKMNANESRFKVSFVGMFVCVFPS